MDGVVDENEEFQPRREILRELEDLKNQNKAVMQELRQKNVVIERYEAELRRYRAQAFNDDGLEGKRRYSKELFDLLKTCGFVDSYRILESLGIDPREADLVKAISKQLEELEGYGVIKAEGKGWRWTG